MFQRPCVGSGVECSHAVGGHLHRVVTVAGVGGNSIGDSDCSVSIRPAGCGCASTAAPSSSLRGEDRAVSGSLRTWIDIVDFYSFQAGNAQNL